MENKFEKFRLEEVVLTQINGGDNGRETDTTDCTWEWDLASGGTRGDTSHDGDWDALC